MTERPPFCKFNYCPDGVACMAAEKCLSIDGLPGKIEHPDGKTSPPQEVPLWMENWLRGKYEQETAKQMGSGTKAQDAASSAGTRRSGRLETPEALAFASDTSSPVNQRNLITPSTPITDAFPTKLMERSIEESLHPKGMSTHDGMVKLASSHVLVILTRARSLERDRAELMEVLRALIAWDEGEGSWDIAGPHMRPFDKARALLARLEK